MGTADNKSAPQLDGSRKQRLWHRVLLNIQILLRFCTLGQWLYRIWICSLCQSPGVDLFPIIDTWHEWRVCKSASAFPWPYLSRGTITLRGESPSVIDRGRVCGLAHGRALGGRNSPSWRIGRYLVESVACHISLSGAFHSLAQGQGESLEAGVLAINLHLVAMR